MNVYSLIFRYTKTNPMLKQYFQSYQYYKRKTEKLVKLI